MIWLIPLALLSGLFGRMGGAGKHGSWYDRVLDTKWRDVGCSAILIISTVHYYGWVSSLWWAYLLTFLLTWAAFCTYWDKVFGYDNFFFAGAMVGVAALPLVYVYPEHANIFLARVGVLAVVWELLNKKLPDRVLCWDRDIVEEFCRYFIAL